MGKFLSTLKAGVADFFADGCMASGAAMAYYTIFSLPPLLVMVFFIAGMFNVSDQKIQEIVSRQIGIPIPEQAVSDFEDGATERLQRREGETNSTDADDAAEPGGLTAVAGRTAASASPLAGLGPVSKAVGVLILIFSATSLFAQLQTALNRAWEVEPDPERSGWIKFLMKRLLSLGMIVVIAFLLLVSLVVTTLVDEGVRLVVGDSGGIMATVIAFLINNGVVLTMVTLLFAAMYKLLPDADMRWKDMWVGSFITALLFVIGKELIGYYLQKSNLGSAWGAAAASMIAMLVWVYYTSVIVLLGAELTQAWARQYGHGIKPEKGAVRVVDGRRHTRREPNPQRGG